MPEAAAVITPADELRAAGLQLLCHHRFPVQPPAGSMDAPGTCLKCGAPWGRRDPVPDWLCGPLAALLASLHDTAPQILAVDEAVEVARAIRGSEA